MEVLSRPCPSGQALAIHENRRKTCSSPWPVIVTTAYLPPHKFLRHLCAHLGMSSTAEEVCSCASVGRVVLEAIYPQDHQARSIVVDTQTGMPTFRGFERLEKFILNTTGYPDWLFYHKAGSETETQSYLNDMAFLLRGPKVTEKVKSHLSSSRDEDPSTVDRVIVTCGDALADPDCQSFWAMHERTRDSQA